MYLSLKAKTPWPEPCKTYLEQEVSMSTSFFVFCFLFFVIVTFIVIVIFSACFLL